MDLLAGRRQSAFKLPLMGQADGNTALGQETENMDENRAPTVGTPMKVATGSRLSATKAPLSPAARSAFRASQRNRGSVKGNPFVMQTSSTGGNTSASSLWTAQAQPVDTKPVPVDVTQSPMFVKRASALMSSQKEVPESPNPVKDTPFKFKVTICPNRRELSITDVDASLVTPRKDYIAISVPKLTLPTMNGEIPDDAISRADSSSLSTSTDSMSGKNAAPTTSSARKRENVEYAESPAKRRRISFGTKSTRKTIMNGGTLKPLVLEGGRPLVSSIFVPPETVTPPNSARDRSDSTPESLPATPTGFIGVSAGEVGMKTPIGGGVLPMASMLKDSQRILNINGHLTVPASKDSELPLTIAEIAAWVIFGQEDVEIVSSFILAYLHFKAVPRDLFKIVWAFYHQPPLQYWKLVSTFVLQRGKVVNFVERWAKMSPEDFDWQPAPPQTPGIATAKETRVPLKFFMKFVEILRSDHVDTSELQSILAKFSNSYETPRKSMAGGSNGSTMGATSPRKSLTGTGRRQSKYRESRQSSIKAGEAITLTQIEPLELATQMTFMDATRLKSLRLAELVGQGWNKADKATAAPRLTNIINHFNNVSYWVAHEITRAETSKEQAKLIERFISVGSKLKDLGNFNGLMEIFSGLISNGVQRLQDAWKLLPSKQMAKYRKFESIMSPFQNASSYRTRLADCSKSPVIPYIGIHLSDIVHIIEGIEDEIPDKYSLPKVLKLGDILKLWHQWKYQSCDIVEDSDITQFLALLKCAVSKD